MTTDFTFISASDIHVSDTGPRSRLDNFKETVLGKIGQMRSACSKLKADAAIIAGDLYNLKAPSRNSHRLNQELIKEFKQFPCPIYMIEGNHDLTANSLDSLAEQPLGVLFADGTLIRLREAIIEKNGVKVSIVGMPYTENIEVKDFNLAPKGDAAAQIGVLHLYSSVKGGMLFKDRLYGYDELSVLGPDVFIIGHYHLDQGTYEYMGKHFVNLGSMTRGTLGEDDIAHHPRICMTKICVDEVGNPAITVTPIRLKIQPASEVFDLEKKEEEKLEAKEIEMFVEKLSQEAVSGSIAESKTMDDIIDSMGIAKIVRDRVIGFIRAAA